jgi:hypothetical protein
MAPPDGTGTCSYASAQRFSSGVLLHGPDDAKTPIARFTGAPTHVAIHAIGNLEDGRNVRVTIRTPASGPALVLRGWIRVDDVSFYTRREIPVAGDHVAIAATRRVRILEARGRTLRVEPLHTVFRGLSADVDCDAIDARDMATASATTSTRGSRPMHIMRDVAVLHDAAGRPVLELRAEDRRPTIDALEARAGMVRVRHANGVRVDGWMREEDLAPGEGAECDHCQGGGEVVDTDDLCPWRAPADRDLDDGCPDLDPEHGPFVALREVSVRSGPSAEAPEIGLLERGAQVYAFEAQAGARRIAPASGEVRSPGGETGFWIVDGALARDPTFSGAPRR